MSSRSLDDLDADMRQKAQQFLAQCAVDDLLREQSATVFITQTYRGNDEQNADYARGRTQPGPVITNAKGGQSPHNCTSQDGTPAALAFDFGIKKADGSLDWNAGDPLWQRAIQIGIRIGLISGSTWHTIKDSPHFEWPNWQAKNQPSA